MLELAAIHAGRLEFHIAPCDLALIVREVVSEQREQHAQRHILLEVPEAPIMVLADANRIGQVIIQYVSNALKFASEDSPVTVLLEARGDQALVSVHDDGPGLPPEEQERVWEAYYRAPGVAVQSGPIIGLGLGLHICRTIDERHGGQTGVESTVGQGATFWFTLPLDPSATGTASP